MNVALSYTPPSIPSSLRGASQRLVTVVMVTLLLALGTALPVADAVPEPVAAAVSYAAPDVIEDFLTADEAAAWGWRAAAAGFTAGVVGGTVGMTCAAGLVGATGGAGALGVGACIALGTGAGGASANLWY